MDGKHIIGVNWDDIKAVGIEGVDTGSTLAGYGQNVVEVLFECKRFPLQGMLDCYGVDAICVKTDTGAHPKRVRHPMSQGIDVSDGVDALGRVMKGSSNMFGADKGNGASRKAGSGKDCKGV